MKKGLLSILAVALTIVSCQNYDDNFTELTGLVTKLSTEVASLSTVKADLSSLTTLVNGLNTAVSQIPDPTSEIANITSGLASATTQIAAIKAVIDSGLATSSDLASITQTIAEITAGVNTLLTKNATLVIDLVINDATTLAAAQELVLTGDTSPAKYILTGAVNVDHTKLNATQIAAADLMTQKIISVSQSVTTSGTVDLSGLSAILSNYTINGTTRPNDSAITSIGGALSVSGKLGDLDFGNLVTIVQNVTITDPASATLIDFRNVVGTSGVIGAAGVNVFANATEVHTGSLSVVSISAAKASAIAVGQTTAAAALTINAPQATVVNGNSLKTIGGALTVTATKTAVVKFTSMTAAASISVPKVVSEFHMPKVLSIGSSTIWAKTVDATKLKTIATATTFKGTTVFVAPDLASITTGALTFTALDPINLPKLDVNAGSIVSTATAITVGTSGDATLLKVIGAGNTTLKSLTIAANKEALALDATTAALTSLSITSGGTNVSAATSYSVTVTDPAIVAMTALTFNGMANVSVTGPAPVLKTLTTSGEMISLTVDNLDALTTLTTGHIPMAYSALPAAIRQSVTITGNLLLKKVDLTSVTQLMVTTITGNAVLATITAPAVGTPLKYNAVLNLVVGAGGVSNAVSVTHTAAVAGGALEDISNASLRSWRDYIRQHMDVQQAKITDGTILANTLIGTAGTGTGSYALSYDTISVGSLNTYIDGVIDTVAELALIDNNILNP